MRIGIDMGHSLEGQPGTGAVGILSEVNENRKIGKDLINMLKAKGHEVVNCTTDTASSTNQQLQGIVSKANAQPLDLFVSIHLNSGGGNGTETYVLTGASSFTRNKATAINNAVVSSCNFYNRGVKEANFYVLRNTTAPAILVEICFVDSQKDADKLIAHKVAKGLFKGITGYEYIETQAPDAGPTPNGETFYRVVCGSFKDKATAEARAAEVKEKTGFDTFLVAFTK